MQAGNYKLYNEDTSFDQENFNLSQGVLNREVERFHCIIMFVS